MKPFLRHLGHQLREQFERLEYLFALVGTVIVAAIAMGMLMHVVHRGFPL